MVKNYIFDFGNVLALFAPDELTEPYVKDPVLRRQVSQVVFDRLYWDRLDAGTITDEEVKAGIRSRLPEELAEQGCRAYDGWVELRKPIPGMQKLVRDIHDMGGKLYLLSNISIGFSENYHKSHWIRELFSLFDGLVFSGPIHMTKPSREIFQYLLDTYSLQPETCVFIDDSPKNIAGGEAAGIQGILFDGNAENLRKQLFPD